jgi:hypothetical protein
MAVPGMPIPPNGYGQPAKMACHFPVKLSGSLLGWKTIFNHNALRFPWETRVFLFLKPFNSFWHSLCFSIIEMFFYDLQISGASHENIAD